MPEKSLIINGATGTLSVGVTLVALALGVPRIYAVARGLPLLERLKDLAPERIETFSNSEGSTEAWVKSLTGGRGADLMVDTLGAVASLDSLKDAMHGAKRGGRIINIGGTAGDLSVDVKWWMDEQMELLVSVWFTSAEAMELAGMLGSGALDISGLQPKSWPLDEINEAISGTASGDEGLPVGPKPTGLTIGPISCRRDF